MRGLRTVLVEQNDLGSGTSSRSSRLVHGGLRYLETGDLRLVLEANQERRVLLRIAPHLVWPLPFLFPVHRGDRVSLWRLGAGMWLYDLLALFRNVRTHRMLGKRARARGGADAAGARPGRRRPVLRCPVRRRATGARHGALRHPPRRAGGELHRASSALERTAGRVVGAQVEDRLTGERAVIRANVVVNATGPWADRVRTLEDAGAAPLLQPTKGIHVVVDRSRHRPPRGHHLHQPDRRPGALHPALGRSLLHRHHRHRDHRAAGPARHLRRRDRLPAPLGQRPLSQRAAGPRGRARHLGRAPSAARRSRTGAPRRAARASTRSSRARAG